MRTAIAASHTVHCGHSYPLSCKQRGQRPWPCAGHNRCQPCPTTTTTSSSSSSARSSRVGATRREAALLVPVALLLSRGDARAAAEAPAAAAAPAAVVQDPNSDGAGAGTSSSSAPSAVLQRFLDNAYELQVPSNYTYLETPIVRVERGPQPERSPVLARFEAPGGQPGSISILVRKANALKQTILQVADISQLGSPVEVAQLILPRGSTLLATATQQVEQPSKETPLGRVELPPQTYYAYEFTTPAGMHVALAAGARKGSVYICGASTTAERWREAGPVFGKVVRSFRIRAQPTIS